jgi:hypothetical protein
VQQLQGVKMHIATSLQLLAQRPGRLGRCWDGSRSLDSCDVADLVSMSGPFKTQFDLPRVSLSEFIHSCANLISYLFAVRETWEFECSISSDILETESELVRDAEAGATSLY